MHKFLFIAFIFSCISGSVVHAQQLIDKVAAKVGGEMILLSDIEARLAYVKSTYGTVDEETKCFVIQDLIAQKILINQAKLDSIVVTDQEVNQEIDARIEQILTSMGNDESKFEAFYGLSVDEVRKQQQSNLRNTLYTQKMRSTVMADVEATPVEVKAFFKNIPNDSIPVFNSEVELSEIVFAPTPSDENVTKAMETLERLRQQVISDSTAFERLASLYSEDPGSKDKAGDLGWQKRGTFVPEFEAAAYNLEAGEVSEVIESPFGFHIIQLLDRRGNLIHTRHILITAQLTQEDLDAAEEELNTIKTRLEADSLTFEYAVRKFSDDRSISYNNGGRMTNPTSGTTFFEIGDLDSDIFFAIDDLEVGEYSEPVLFDKLNEDVVYKLYRLDSSSEPHTASLDRDYDAIQRIASENKKERLFNEWLYNRITETHIEVDPRFNCQELRLWLEGDM